MSECLFLPPAQTICLNEGQSLAPSERLKWIRQQLAQVPDTAGVYYFLAQNKEPLYIGKSIHLKARLVSHLQAAKDEERAARFVLQAVSLQFRQTAGDFHAQLLENREIKSLFPLLNRAQRRLKRFFTWQFSKANPGQLQLQSMQSDSLDRQDQVCFGFYKTAKAAKDSILSLADREKLCLRLLGFEKAKGACFRSQINKCAGACAGRETHDEMIERLLESLLPMSFQLWPHAGLLQIEEQGYWHGLYQWQSLGLFQEKLSPSAQKALIKATPLSFDKDEYRIIKRNLAKV